MFLPPTLFGSNKQGAVFFRQTKTGTNIICDKIKVFVGRAITENANTFKHDLIMYTDFLKISSHLRQKRMMNICIVT